MKPQPGGGDLCTTHARQAATAGGLAHGRVTGEIPLFKLRSFLDAERKADERVLRDNADQERQRRGEKPRAKKAKRYYTRARLWAEAVKYASADRSIDSLRDLTPEELERCVAKVHEYFRKNPRLLDRPGVRNMGFVKLGQGPGPRAPLEDPSYAYNGENGGKNFQWYKRGLFGMLLKQAGFAGSDLSRCTERQCMVALLATSEKLRIFPMETAELVPYAGPQCYPHLAEKKRLNADRKPAVAVEDATPPEIAHAREQMRCWLRCDDCRKLRLIDRRSFPALDPCGFSRDPQEDSDLARRRQVLQDDCRWREWLDASNVTAR